MNEIKLRTLKWLVDSGHIDLNEDWTAWQTSPLIRAIDHGSLEMCELLIEAGADVNRGAGDKEKSWRPVHYVGYHIVSDGRAKAELLLRHGADIEAKNHWGASALYCAVYFGCYEVAMAFIEAGADVNSRCTLQEESILDCARAHQDRQRSRELIEALVARGAKSAKDS